MTEVCTNSVLVRSGGNQRTNSLHYSRLPLLKQLTSGQEVFPGLASAFTLFLSYSALRFVEKSRFILLTNHSLLMIIVTATFSPLAAVTRFSFEIVIFLSCWASDLLRTLAPFSQPIIACLHPFSRHWQPPRGVALSYVCFNLCCD